jgi:hypothetical protein
MRKIFLLSLVLAAHEVAGQQLVFPPGSDWTQLDEGKELAFTLSLSDGTLPLRYSLEGGGETGMKLDTVGHFSWIPSFDLVNRLDRQKEVSVIFEAQLKGDKRIRQPVNFLVHHVNRAPLIDELPVFYVKQNTASQYQISADFVRDPDGDPVIFKPRESLMPEGASLTSLGLLTWTPSRLQFNNLKAAPLTIEFTVQDQPDRAESIGKIRVAQTQLDLPPDLLIVPGDTVLNIRENETVNFKVYVSDPNGDENIDQVGFISSDVRVLRAALKENSKVQQEFTWSPGYDFVDDAEKRKTIILTFFAFDKSSNRVQRKVRITINDTENVEEKDKILYQKYFNSLAVARNLMDALDANHDKMEKAYRRARKGKKNRTILNASLGAMTGLSPLVLPPDPAKGVTVVGGTSVLTLNSLEAGSVIGRNVNEYQNKVKTNRDLRSQLQLKGNFFARKYALKSARRGSEFEQDRDELSRLVNSESLTTLELSADVVALPGVKEIKKTFPDFGDER